MNKVIVPLSNGVVRIFAGAVAEKVSVWVSEDEKGAQSASIDLLYYDHDTPGAVQIAEELTANGVEPTVHFYPGEEGVYVVALFHMRSVRWEFIQNFLPHEEAQFLREAAQQGKVELILTGETEVPGSKLQPFFDRMKKDGWLWLTIAKEKQQDVLQLLWKKKIHAVFLEPPDLR
jgi:hypothetical protein